VEVEATKQAWMFDVTEIRSLDSRLSVEGKPEMIYLENLEYKRNTWAVTSAMD